MAYVAITKTLRDEMKNTIYRLREAEVNSMPDPVVIARTVSSTEACMELVMGKLWGSEADLRERLDKYSQKRSVRVVVDGPNSSIQFDINVNQPCIINCDRYSTHVLTLNGADTVMFNEALEARQGRNEATNRWNGVESQVLAFMESCKSLNEAVKLWPDVQRYIPKDYIERLGQKTEKQARDMSNVLEALKAIDMDSVHTSTVLARMAGARI
jgi:hypothetical protein